MKNISSKAFIALLAVLFISDNIDPHRSFSEYEKRVLASIPKWDLDALIDGSLTLDLESAINDQFIGRDLWIQLKAKLESSFGKVENNGILLGKQGILFEKRLTLNPQSLDNVKYLKEFLEMVSDLKVTSVLVPNKEAIYPEHLPTGFPMLNQLELLKEWKKSIALLDISDELKAHSSEDLYYKTDHHWTLKGAYVAYETLMKTWGYEAKSYESFSPYKVEGFLGTYYNRSRFDSIKSESLGIINPDIISYETDGKTYSSLINSEALKGNDLYGAFLYGNHGYGHIVVRNATSPRRLLVIKDSYANSLIPMLTSAFDEIDVIDLRQYNGSLQAILKQQNYDQILLLQSFNQFSDEINEAKLRY
jgi:hypothetical protein